MKTIILGVNKYNFNKALTNCACVNATKDSVVIRFTKLLDRKATDSFVLASSFTLALALNVNTNYLEFITSLTPTPLFEINLMLGHYELRVYTINSYTFNYTTPDWDNECLLYSESAYVAYKQN